MRKRSRLYFDKKLSVKHTESVLASLMPIFEAYNLSMEAMKILRNGPSHPLRPGGIAIAGKGKDEIMILPSGHFIRQGKISSEMLKKPIEDMTKAFNREIIEDIVRMAKNRPSSPLSSSPSPADQ